MKIRMHSTIGIKTKTCPNHEPHHGHGWNTTDIFGKDVTYYCPGNIETEIQK